MKYPTPIRESQSSSPPAKIHDKRMINGSLKKSLATTTPRSDVKRKVLSTPRRSARVHQQDPITFTPATVVTEIDATTPVLENLRKMVIEQLWNSGGAIRHIQDSMGTVQGPYEITTRHVSMSNSGGVVQSSKDVKPKGNMRNKSKAPPTEPKRYGTRQRKSEETLEH